MTTAASGPNRAPTRKQREGFLANAALTLIVFFALLPIVTTILISFKREEDVTRKPPVIFPCDTATSGFDITACRWSTEGYERVILAQPSESAPFGFQIRGRMLTTYLPNTVLYASVTGLLVVLLASLSGYAFSRYQFRGKMLLMTGILAITGVPLLTNLLALYQMGITIRKSGIPIYDDRIFLMLTYTGFFLPLSVWIAKGFFDAIPRELEEAALIDGLSPLGSLFRITLPLAMPGMLSIFLLTFVNVWNEFIAGYLLVSKNELKPAMFGMYDFLGQNIINAQVIAAASIIIALPMVVVFLLARRSFFRAMVEGAIKG
ncbi:MAG: carbohydrate ABC transporter permease [Anaerolineae bacterium]|jgi:ABC-type glycerol-3-phosphate transport system permease component|nr:carbohydrate ABC transporter permease [Anaerolineae bacterium]